jgi:hypothetical protein
VDGQWKSKLDFTLFFSRGGGPTNPLRQKLGFVTKTTKHDDGDDDGDGLHETIDSSIHLHIPVYTVLL